MDRYQRVEKPRPETPISENEIRITTQGKMRNYITYATTLLQEKGAPEIVLKAMGRAINKTVTIAEIIKRRIAGLHQNTSIGSTDITDLWQPLEEGLLPLETTRHVSMIAITLSIKELEKSTTGYQPPLPADQVKPLVEFEYDADCSPRGARGRGRGRGRARGKGNDLIGTEYNGLDGSWGRSRGRGLGRGRARGGYRGRGREQDPSSFDEPHTDGPSESRGAEVTQDISFSGCIRGRGKGRGQGRGKGRALRTDGPTQGQAHTGAS